MTWAKPPKSFQRNSIHYSEPFRSTFDPGSGKKIRILGRHLETFPHERLQGREEFRLRVGDYRIIYHFDTHQNEVVLLTVGHRREVYRVRNPPGQALYFQKSIGGLEGILLNFSQFVASPASQRPDGIGGNLILDATCY